MVDTRDDSNYFILCAWLNKNKKINVGGDYLAQPIRRRKMLTSHQGPKDALGFCDHPQAAKVHERQTCFGGKSQAANGNNPLNYNTRCKNCDFNKGHERCRTGSNELPVFFRGCPRRSLRYVLYTPPPTPLVCYSGVANLIISPPC